MDVRALDNLANLARQFARHMPQRHGDENTGYEVNIALQLELVVQRERQSLTQRADALSKAAHASHLSCAIGERAWALEPTGT